MKKGWELKSLGEICKVERGSSPRPIDKYFTISEDGVNWIKIGDTNGITKYLYSTKERITKEGAKQSRFVKEGDFILSNSMSFGNPFIMKTQGYIHDGWFVLRLPAYIDTDYFYYLLTSPNVQEQIHSLANGAIVKNISGDLVKQVKLVYPKLQEQKRIVLIIDEIFVSIDQAKENIQRNLQNAKELFQSELNGIFTNKGDGWIEKKLGEVSLVFGRGKSKHRPRNDEKLYGGNYPFIQTGDVRNSNKFITQYTQTYNDVGLSQSKLWPKGTICITIAANIAETGILNFDSCFPDSMIGLVVDEKKADMNFAYYALQFLKSELQLLGKGSAQHNINLGTFEYITFPFPSLIKQKQIVKQLDALSSETKKLEEKYEQKLNHLEALKKSMLQKAFSGELTLSEL